MIVGRDTCESMVAGSSKVATEIASASEPSDRDEELRLSRLQVSAYGFDVDFDDDDDGHPSSERDVGLASFKQGEAETIKNVLNQVEEISMKRQSEGFNEINFTFGVLNCFLISYTIGAFPQHLWLLYLIESFFHIPRRFYNMWHARPLNEALYYLDFCWCMNFFGIFLLVILLIFEAAGMSAGLSVREMIFKAMLGVACGVLLAANIALPFVACIFHDVNSMTSLFIHLMPPIVMYTFLWHADEVVSSWPGIFNLSYLDEVRYFDGFNGVAGCSTVLYFIWLVLYISFMLLGGLDLPRKYKRNGAEATPKWDTVFHHTMRQGVCVTIGSHLRGRRKRDSLQKMEENDFDVTDLLIYLFGHMTAALGSIYTIGYASFSNKYLHGSLLGASIIVAVIRGGKRYTYYSTKVYSMKLKKQFASIIHGADGDEGNYSRMA